MKLTWGEITARTFIQGIDRVVIYPRSSGIGQAWSGVSKINVHEDDDNSTTAYVDGQKYRQAHILDSYRATVEGFTYPPVLDSGGVYDMCYRTRVGNAGQGLDAGYRIHIVYNAQLIPADLEHSTINADSDADTFSWEVYTRPVAYDIYSPSARFVIDTTKTYDWTIAALEAILYGTDTSSPRLPTATELVNIFDTNAILKITDNKDGTFTAEGPDSVVGMIDDTTFFIDWPSVVFIDADSAVITSQ